MPLTRAQARRVDQFAIDELGFPGIVLMENAGRGAAEVLLACGVDGPVIVLGGKGNNAGDGFVLARRLAVLGHEVRLVLTFPPDRLAGDARTAFEMLKPCGVPLLDLSEPSGNQGAKIDAFAAGAVWVIDALLGTGTLGAPRPPIAGFITWANRQPARRMALDLPSGLDADTGEALEPTFRADLTATFVDAKAGFSARTAAKFLGEVAVVDIGLPPTVIAKCF